ncbi:18S rRNA biogenesis protein [Dothidotthia symphoricarpi CBS 119687]|uniref:18S rRNA biogenesis protein n=1 Tax=Dothidotthia symphoricarpi CBS 119687 TaxID=1392245 RepID=A0A6A6AKY1_9PLEO|nr:18S rRNA biogenesis protein [Dothidotthia symphoricarpi CBS 119687]KAF2132622.1 18S rRNA biogenesis protein [Dothidotthia symphoricarpi CBS 119687]
MAADESLQAPLNFSGHRHLITRLLLSTLTGRPIRITAIRSSSTNPGLTRHETNFIRLLDAITNGSQIQFSMTGTTLVYRPGLITGSAEGLGASGGVIRHEIPRECAKRGVSWWLIPLCLLSPFSKGNVNVIFHGEGCVTSCTQAGDVSADTVRTALLPLYKSFGIDRSIELRILKRSCAPSPAKSAGGEVQLVFNHQVRLPKTLHLLNPGRVKKIRGVAYCVEVPKTNNERMIFEARGILNKFVPDTYIFSDASPAPLIPTPAQKGTPAQKVKGAVGFGLSLVAESSTGCIYSADVCSPPEGGVPADDIGRQCAYQLLEKISQGGCVESVAAPTILMLMAMGTEDVGRVGLGRDVLATEEVIQLARDSKVFGGSGWGFRDAGEGKEEVVVSVVGRGVGNVGRKVA